MKKRFTTLLTLLLLAIEMPLWACTLVVSSNADSGANTLRDMIACATSGDVITFAPSMANQTITLASTLEIPVGKNLTIDGLNAPNLTLSGNNAVRIFLLQSTSVNPTSLTLKNLRLINGLTTEFGGAVRSQHQGVLNIENCTFEANNAHRGGSAVFSHFEGSTTILNCTFNGNISIAENDERGSTVMLWGPNAHSVRNSNFTNNRGINGAAINGLNAALLVEDCNFTNNRTTDATFDTGQPNDFLRGYGGAIYTDRATPAPPSTATGSIILRRCNFIDNIAQADGGACNLYTDNTDNVLIENCYFNNNESRILTGGTNGGSGGAVVQMNNNQNNGFVVRNSTFSNNRAAVNAGAIRADWANTTIENCTFFNNRAQLTSLSGTSANGGALAFYSMASSTVNVTNCTFSTNYAGWVGGAIAGPASIRIKNNIFFQNTAGNGGNTWNIQQHSSNHFTDLGNNLQFPNKFTNLANDYNVSASVTIANPLLGTLGNNGGFAPTIPILAGSPAINAGAGCTPTDQRGVARVGVCDIGAFEFDTPPPPPSQTDIVSSAVFLNCGMTEAQAMAAGAATLSVGGSNYYIGTRQVSAINQNPIMLKFTGGVLDWCREDYETTGADGRGYGLFDSGTGLYAIFSTDGTQGTVAQDYRRFCTSGWLKTYTDASPGGGGGPKVAIIVKIDPATGAGLLNNGTFITARTSSNTTNSMEVTDMYLDASSNIIVRANSWFRPRKTDRTAMTQTGTGGSPHDYTVIFTPNLQTAICASAVGWDNGTGVDCLSGSVTPPPVGTPEIQVLQGTTNLNQNASYNFGTTPEGTPVTRTFIVRNVGTAPLSLGALSSIPAGFSLVGTFPSGTIAAGAQVSFQIRLNATAAGTYTGLLSFVNGDADENPFNLTLNGTVNPPATGGGGSGTGGGGGGAAPVVCTRIGDFDITPLSASVLKLEWNVENGITPIGFVLYRNNTLLTNLPATANQYLDGNLDASRRYTYRLEPICAGGTPQDKAASAYTLPPNPTTTEVLAACGEGSVILKVEGKTNWQGVYRWYENQTDTTPLFESAEGIFQTPSLSQSRFYYVSIFELGQEGERTAVEALVGAAYQARIANVATDTTAAGGLVLVSCESLITLEAELVDGATAYVWKRDGNLLGANSPTLQTRVSGKYELLVFKGNCVVTSPILEVQLNSRPQFDLIEVENKTGRGFCRQALIAIQPDSTLLGSLPLSYTWFLGDSLVSQDSILTTTQTGRYRAVVTENRYGCSAEKEVEVRILPLPESLTISASSLDFCADGRVQLGVAALPDVSYEWFLNGIKLPFNRPQIEVTEGGSYQVRASYLRTACVAWSDSVMLLQYQAPTLRILPEGTALKAEVSPALPYAWYKLNRMNNLFELLAGTENMELYQPTESGSYRIIAQYGTNCTAESRSYTFQALTTALDDTLFEALRLYPNPTQAQSTLILPEGFGKGDLSLFDTKGQILYRLAFNQEGKIEIPLQNYAVGIYFLKVQNERGARLFKVVRE
ncbi:choice-of-anchor Q domain-containing protein [Hugenholtzia roseola]|uniref:choice-of-anchor Q domain-containing protein n=1 Tax=Hugenholtzia roseola TaxID=1002 RepID=UPI00137723F8|nr:choice-of-anchor Q domain-containing protein [Hugenholtzia roseola]